MRWALMYAAVLVINVITAFMVDGIRTGLSCALTAWFGVILGVHIGKLTFGVDR